MEKNFNLHINVSGNWPAAKLLNMMQGVARGTAPASAKFASLERSSPYPVASTDQYFIHRVFNNSQIAMRHVIRCN